MKNFQFNLLHTHKKVFLIEVTLFNEINSLLCRCPTIWCPQLKWHVFGLNFGLKGPINVCPKVNCYQDTEILRIMVVYGTTVW